MTSMCLNNVDLIGLNEVICNAELREAKNVYLDKY